MNFEPKDYNEAAKTIDEISLYLEISGAGQFDSGRIPYHEHVTAFFYHLGYKIAVTADPFARPAVYVDIYKNGETLCEGAIKQATDLEKFKAFLAGVGA